MRCCAALEAVEAGRACRMRLLLHTRTVGHTNNTHMLSMLDNLRVPVVLRERTDWSSLLAYKD